MTDTPIAELLTLTTDIVAAHVENNRIAASDLPAIIAAVYNALAGLGNRPGGPAVFRKPAISIDASVTPTHLVCLDCGAEQTALKRHLMSKHGLTPDQYRVRWALPQTYSMVLASYSERHGEMAKSFDLGRSRNTKTSTPKPKKR